MAAKPIEFDAEGGKLQVSIKATGGIEALYAIIFWPDPEQNPQDRRILTAFKSTRGGTSGKTLVPVNQADGAGLSWILHPIGPVDLTYKITVFIEQDGQRLKTRGPYSGKITAERMLDGHRGKALLKAK